MAKKTALGRGLDSLNTETSKKPSSENQDVRELSIKRIVPNPDQPRRFFHEQELNELAESIKQVGVLQPLLVRKKGQKFEIIAGERRYQAATLAGLEKVPVREIVADDKEVLTLALVENLQRSDLNPIEEARGYRALIDQEGLTQEKLAQLVSKSRSTITNALRLLDLPKEVQDYLFDGELTAGHARAILAVPLDDQRIRLANKVIQDRLSVRQTESLAPLFSGTENAEVPQRKPTPRSFKIAARELRTQLNTNVRVKSVRGKNKIEIEFTDEDQLKKILDRIIG